MRFLSMLADLAIVGAINSYWVPMEKLSAALAYEGPAFVAGIMRLSMAWAYFSIFLRSSPELMPISDLIFSR